MQSSAKKTPNLPRLKAMYFCSPDFLSLSEEEVATANLLVKEIPASSTPPPESFKFHLADSSIPLSEIPLFFGSPPTQNSLPWHLHPEASSLGETLQYAFEDGTVLSVREIFYHPYCQSVDRRLLPLLSSIETAGGLPGWLTLVPGNTLSNWGSLRKAELALIVSLLQAPDIIDISITDSADRSIKRFGLPLNKISTLPELKSRWQVQPSAENKILYQNGYAELNFNVRPTHSDGIIFKTFEISKSHSTLYFHPYWAMSKAVRNLLAARALDPERNKNPIPLLQEKEPFHFTVTGHSFIQDTTEELEEILLRSGFPPIERVGLHEVGSNQIESQVWIQKTGKFHFVRTIEESGKKWTVYHFPRMSRLLGKGLNYGLGATCTTDHKEIAQSRKGIRRGRDLKVLKHSGMFLLIVLETTSYLFHKRSFQGKPLSDRTGFLTHLLSHLGLILYEIEKKAGFIDLNPAPSLEKLCSKKVIELIENFTDYLIDQAKNGKDSLFLESGETRLANSGRNMLELLHRILAQVAYESRGQCFLKGKIPGFSSLVSFDDALPSESGLQVLHGTAHQDSLKKFNSYEILNTWIKPSQVLHSLLPLRDRGFRLFYDGMLLDEMKMADFNPEFEVVESSEPDKPTVERIDWFELNPRFFFKGVEIHSSQLERLSKEGVLEFQGRIYLIQNKNLPNIRRLENFWAKIQASQNIDNRKKTGKHYLRLPKNQTLEMLALRASGFPVKGGPRWNRICEFYDSLDKRKELSNVPTSVHAKLKHYQLTGVQWLLDIYHLGLGGILADDMGLGKTVQTLSFLECLRGKNEMGKTLIVVPTSLTYNWVSESSRFTPEIPILIFQSRLRDQARSFLKENKQCILISTYGLFTEHQEFISQENWNIIVFDEAQNLKNISAKRTTASRSINARFKLCLTGTPLENHLGEFYSLLDLVVSGSLGELSTFREKFIAPETIDKAELAYLKMKARPLVLRRTKSEILKELPPKLETTIKLPFEQKQERIYRDIALSWNEKVKESILAQGESKTQLMMLTALLRLRQACSDPSSIPNIRYTEEPPKITVLMEALHEITESGESALVFTQFLHTFERIKKELTKNKIPFFCLHGGTSRPEREKVLRHFQEAQGGSVLLMTLKTGGVGLNLVKASYVFHLEPWWNPAVENQATDRAHRIGQKKPVQVYRYLMKESVEEKIEVLKERKSAKFDALFNSTEREKDIQTGGALLSQSDFEYLLS